MRLDDRARFGIDFARDMLLVEFLAELDEAFFFDTLHELCSARHQPRKADRAEAVLRDDLCGFGNFLDRHFAALEFLAQHRGCRVARDDRAVEIEQRSDMRPGLGRENFFQMRLRSRHACLPTNGYIAAYPCTMTGKMGLINGAKAPTPPVPAPRSAPGRAAPTEPPSCRRRTARRRGQASRAPSRGGWRR